MAAWDCRCDAKQGFDCVVCCLKDGGHYRGVANEPPERAFRKRRIAERHFDFVERDAGLVRG
jgi:hypothetical protein